MRFFHFFLFSLAALPVLMGQEPIQTMPIEGPNRPWSNLELNNDPRKFHFVVVTDRTGGHRPGVWMKGVKRINLMQPEFVVSVGDLIEGYTENREQLDREWAEFNGFIDQLEMPFFYVAGNHDYTNEVMADLWQDQFGTDYYYFVYKNILFLCLNSEDGATALQNPDIGDEQLAFAAEVLADHPEVDWTMVFMHQPLWLRESAKNWTTLETRLAARKHTVFTGHLHQYTLYERNKTDYFVLATMGGGSDLSGKRFGRFDHFLWVTMTADGPYYANVLLDGVEGKDLRTPEDIAREEGFRSAPPVRFEPYYYTKNPASTIPWKVVLTNPTEETCHYTIVLNPSGQLSPVEQLIEQDLGPGERVERILPVKTARKWPEEASPLLAEVNLQTADYEWGSRVNLLPYPRYEIKKTSRPVTIDGDLREWKRLRFTHQDESGDSAFHFDLCEDEEFLYLAMEVKDDDLQAGFGHSNRNQDGAYIIFDARPMDQSAYNLRRNNGVYQGEWLFLMAIPDGNTFELGFAEMMPEGVQGQGKRIDGGYSVEFVIPQALLQDFQGGTWEYLRISPAVMDLDADERIREVYWQSNWTENYPGSGMFFRKK